MEDNHDFTLNADNLINPRIRSHRISLVVVALFLLNVQLANADPVGDFFKKVGQSISKPFQPQPAPQQQTRKTRSPRRPASRISSSAEASVTPTPIEEPSSKPAKEEKTTP